MWMKWATFVGLSTMTHIESYHVLVLGNPTIKSIPISFHFHFWIFKACSDPVRLWCSALTLWQVSHKDTYSMMSRFIPYHQYLVFKSLYILVLPGWIEYVESCASDQEHISIFSTTKGVFGWLQLPQPGSLHEGSPWLVDCIEPWA
jgi:hypothetical protein